MQFRTEITVKPSIKKITHADTILTVGSCFAERIGNKLTAGKFNTLVNPFGTIFNPVSLLEILRLSSIQENLPANLYTTRDNIWLHYFTHAELFANTQEELTTMLKTKLAITYKALKEAKFLCITFGTAWVYALAGKDNVTVANCHKQPANTFEKKLLTVNDIVTQFERTKEAIKNINPAITYLLTVSPVRHIKDTLELNTVSKAILRLATYEIVGKETNNAQYFPAYELLLDDLRDYRFYSTDLLHPNEASETYIWEKFEETYFSTETKNILKKINHIQTALTHRPLQKNSISNKNFLLKIKQDILNFNQLLWFESELIDINQRLSYFE